MGAVYADKKLMSAASNAAISHFFGLNPEAVIWKRDLHYTTSQAEIVKLFNDDY